MLQFASKASYLLSLFKSFSTYFGTNCGFAARFSKIHLLYQLHVQLFMFFPQFLMWFLGSFSGSWLVYF